MTHAFETMYTQAVAHEDPAVFEKTVRNLSQMFDHEAAVDRALRTKLPTEVEDSTVLES